MSKPKSTKKNDFLNEVNLLIENKNKFSSEEYIAKLKELKAKGENYLKSLLLNNNLAAIK